MGTATRQPTAGTYLNLGLLAFAVVGWELVLLLLESVLPAFTTVGPLHAAVVHWALTGTGWLVGSAVVLRAARRREGFIPDPAPPARRLRRGVAVLALVLVCVGFRWAGQGGPFPPIAEYGRMVEAYDDLAWVALVMQWLYYTAEVVVMTLIIAFGQRAGELRFGRPALPWGGLLLAGAACDGHPCHSSWHSSSESRAPSDALIRLAAAVTPPRGTLLRHPLNHLPSRRSRRRSRVLTEPLLRAGSTIAAGDSTVTSTPTWK